MKRIALLSILISVATAFSQSFLTAETNFFGLPGFGGPSTLWFLNHSDSTESGLKIPTDVEVLKLAPTDYRLVILEGYDPHFMVIRLQNVTTLQLNQVIRSGVAPDTCKYGISMCLMQAGEYFEPETDRIAVVFQYGATVGIYKLDRWTNQMTLQRSFQNPTITKPLGIFWMNDHFLLAEEDSQHIFLTDEYGVIESMYGRLDYDTDGYFWLSDFSGYRDAMGNAQVYVSDGMLGRVDQLTASGTGVELRSQAWPLPADSFRLHMHEIAMIPDIGLIGLDREQQRLYFWGSLDSLQNAARIEADWTRTGGVVVHLWQTAGRLVVAALDSSSAFWDIRSFHVNASEFDDPDPIPLGHWTLADSPIIITDSLHVSTSTSGTLTIDAGVVVKFDQGAALVVDAGSLLDVNGAAGSPVTFESWQAGEAWGGIYVNGGQVELSYANVSGATSTIFANNPSGSGTPVLLENCTFDGAKTTSGNAVLRLWGSPSLKQMVNNCTVDNVATGYGLFFWNCYVSCDELQVLNCAYSNSYIKQVTGSFRSCEFRGHSSNHGILFSSPGTTPNFQCCTFEYLSPGSAYNAPLFAMPTTAPTFGQEGSGDGVSNVIKDSTDCLLKFYGNGIKPIIDNVLSGGGAGGHNDWYQTRSTGKHIIWSSAPAAPAAPYSAQNQYWNHAGVTVPSTNDFTPSSVTYFAFDNYQSNPWGLCGGAGAVYQPGNDHERARLDDVGELDSLFFIGLGLEIEEEFSGAQELFHDVAMNSSNSDLRWQAMSHIVSTQRHLDGAAGDAWIPGLFVVLQAADSFTYDGHVFSERLLSSYHVDRGEFDQAISILVTLLSSGLNAGDSLLVADDLVCVQILQNSVDSGGLDESAWERIPASLRIHSREHGFALDRALISQWVGVTERANGRDLIIPTEFRLYQNYPNPFNPTTEIEFDVPELTRVKVQIFNTLGQLVTTLVDEQRAAGRHTVTWDAAALPSGVYVYRMQALGFADAKKMVLIR